MNKIQYEGSTPFFSVIIPLYNKVKYIKRAVNSAVKQTFSAIEIIIVNDSSTDNSVQELNKIKDTRIRLLHRSRPGPGGYAARNYGIKKAIGEYIAFLDADDEWLPDYLEEIWYLIQKYPRAQSFFSAYIIKFSSGEKRINRYALKNKNIRRKFVPQKEFLLAAAKGLSPMITSCFVVKKTTFEASGGFPDGKCKRGGDVDTWMRIALQGDLAWTAYQGMYYHKDIPDQVTELYGYPHVPYVYKGVLEILDTLPKKEAQLIKKYANRYSHRNILESLLEHKLTREFLNSFFKEVDIFKYLVYKVLYSLPFSLGYKIYVSFKHLKKVLLK